MASVIYGLKCGIGNDLTTSGQNLSLCFICRAKGYKMWARFTIPETSIDSGHRDNASFKHAPPSCCETILFYTISSWQSGSSPLFYWITIPIRFRLQNGASTRQPFSKSCQFTLCEFYQWWSKLSLRCGRSSGTFLFWNVKNYLGTTKRRTTFFHYLYFIALSYCLFIIFCHV